MPSTHSAHDFLSLSTYVGAAPETAAVYDDEIPSRQLGSTTQTAPFLSIGGAEDTGSRDSPSFRVSTVPPPFPVACFVCTRFPAGARPASGEGSELPECESTDRKEKSKLAAQRKGSLSCTQTA